MAAKYDPLARALMASSPQAVTMTFAELDELVGGLPAGARADRTWWGNTTHPSRSQARAWMDAGYRVEALELKVAVTFVPADENRVGRRAGAGRRVRSVLDGVEQLAAVLTRAGYPSVAAAVAEHTVFLHPDTVAQTRGSAIFPIIRNPSRRGQFETADDGRRLLLDDNRSPTDAFRWAAGLTKGRDVQFNHVWNYSRDADSYTALWNLCATPAFLAKTTDGSNHPEVTAALRYHAYRLFGARPANEPVPARPDGYELLAWAPHPDPVTSLEEVYRTRLRASRKSPAAIACREIGWLYSAWLPDSTL